MSLQKTSIRPPDGPRGGRLRLVVLCPEGVKTCALPAAGALTLGRALEADVAIDDPEVSRLHARLHVGPTLAVEDLGSSNGTRLDGRVLRRGERGQLAVGRAFELGGTLAVVQPVAPTAAEGSAAPSLRDVAPPESGMRVRIVVADPAMAALHQMVERVAVGEISVLLLGETGVGKEVFAERIHQRSPRAAGPFLRLNCAALSESLLEAELFGHEKGAFTGASAARVGLLESAAGGTLFLDEVGELPAPVQVKLLRVLEERKVLPVGARQPRAIDVRVVSATHRDLEADCAAGRFRSDLYFRLNGVSLVVPPLRARVGEVESLAALFLEEAARRSRRPAPTRLSAEALATLRRWPWPGNLRELRNVMERAALFATGDAVEAEHLPDAMRAPPPAPLRMRDRIEEMERQRMVDALAASGGNQTQAAAALGMPRRTFVYKLKRYGIARGEPAEGDG